MKVIFLASALALAACGGDDPVADEANNAAMANVDIDVLPPDESMTTPADELAAGVQNDSGDAADSNAALNVSP